MSVLVLRFCALKLIFKLIVCIAAVRPLANVYKTTVVRIASVCLLDCFAAFQRNFAA